MNNSLTKKATFVIIFKKGIGDKEMKKLLSIIIAIVIISSFSGCFGSNTQLPTDRNESDSSFSSSEEKTTEPTTEKATEEETTEPITESTTGSEAESIKLTELTSVGDQPEETDKLTDNYENNYRSAIISGSNDTYEYILDGKYSSLKGTLYIPKGESHDFNTTLTVKGDGHILYSSPVMTKTSKPVEFDVPIAGFNKLVIEWYEYQVKCCIADPILVKANPNDSKAVDIKTLPIIITDLTSIDDKPERTFKLTDTFGNTYSNAIYSRSPHSDLSFEYLLDKKYSKFKCTLYIPKGEKLNKTVTMIIDGDGEEIYQSPAMSVSSKPVDVEVDLSKYNDVKIHFLNDKGKSTNSKSLCLGTPYFYLI